MSDSNTTGSRRARARRASPARSLGAALAALPLLVPAVSALTPAGVAWAASPRQPDLQTLAQAAARGDDEISAARLRELLLARRGDFTLLDIRSAQAFADGHIDGARNVPLARLLDPAEVVRLRKSPQVIVYAESADKQAQAAALLRVAGVPALALAGGLAGWAHALDHWSGQRDQFAIVRALNECPQAAPAQMPALQPEAGAAAAPTAPVPSAAPPAKTRGPRVNLKGMCS